MFAWLAGKRDVAERAERLHDAIVAEARAPHLYAGLGVPDTTDGRFEMLALHMVLVLDRLGRMGPASGDLARAVSETYVVAMDDAMRAIGVGDLAVPRKVKKAAAALFDRNAAFGPALAATLAGDDAGPLWQNALATTLAQVEGATAVDLKSLAHYAGERAKALAAVPNAALLDGRLTAAL